jgi:hypothetical protein
MEPASIIGRIVDLLAEQAVKPGRNMKDEVDE